MICDFSDANVLDRIVAGEGVKIAMTDKDPVTGRRALEVRVGKFSVHGNQWPSVVLGPKFFTKPIDLSNYSKVNATVRNVTAGVASLNITLSTLPYNDGGRNLEGEVCSIPGCTTSVCSIPTRGFEVNDASSICLMYFTFPPNEIDAIYHIELIEAVDDPKEGSPAEQLRTDAAGLSRQFEALKQKVDWKDLSGEAREALQHRAEELGKTITRIKDECAGIGTPAFVGRYKPLREELDKQTREMGALMLAGKKDFFAWEIDPYENILRNETPSPESRPLEKIAAFMAQGEFRDKVFMVSACDREVRLEVKVTPSGGLPRDAVLIQETLYIPNSRPGQETGDAVYLLNGPLPIPKGESRQVRVRFDARFSGIKPGRYPFDILLKDLDTGVQKTLPGMLEVWNFKLPSYDMFTNNSYTEFDSSEFSSGELFAKAVAHLKMNGQNAIYIHPVEMTRAVKADEEGNIISFDDSAFENRVGPALKAWKAAPGDESLKFIFTIPGSYNLGLNRSDLKFPEAKWKRTFAQWLTHLKELARRLGVDDKNWYMVLGDEASESALQQLEIPMAEAIKSIDPNIKTSCNTSTVIGDPALTQRFYKSFDTLQPHLPSLKTNPYLLDWIRKSGKTIWAYKCLGNMGLKGKNVYEYYRVYGWDLMKYGITGAGVWTYCAQAQSQRGGGYLMIHKHNEDVMHSRRYEMLREGLDDYRYIQALTEVAKKKGAQAARKANDLIQAAIADITSNVTDTSRCDKWRMRIAGEILKLNGGR